MTTKSMRRHIATHRSCPRPTGCPPPMAPARGCTTFRDKMVELAAWQAITNWRRLVAAVPLATNTSGGTLGDELARALLYRARLTRVPPSCSGAGLQFARLRSDLHCLSPVLAADP